MHTTTADLAPIPSAGAPAPPASRAGLPRRLAGLPRRDLPGGRVLVAAATPLSRLRGLAGLAALPAGVGLHLPGCRSVHTLGMAFALDLIWLDAAGRPVRVDRAVAPRRLRACRWARSVVEVGAGEADGFLAGLAASGPPASECGGA